MSINAIIDLRKFLSDYGVLDFFYSCDNIKRAGYVLAYLTSSNHN